MGYPIRALADVTANAAARLQELGVTTTEQLLDAAGDPEARRALAAQVGASAEQVLAWVNEADLMRIPDVAQGYPALLEAAGVETLRDLASRDADLLSARIAEVNTELRLTERVPTAGQVSAWIAQAKSMVPAVRE